MIRLEAVTKNFASKRGTLPALHGIDLQVGRGEIFGIIGASGAGKSTLVRLINLLERPSSGQVWIDGQQITDARGTGLQALRRQIGMVFQHFNLLSGRTVARNVAYPLELAGKLTKAQIAEKVAALLARVGLSDHAQKYPRQLSGGQKQRVGIARALANDPKVLLCDEATSALDPQTTGQVLDLLQEINRELGVTIVMITHEMEVIRRACDRVAVLEKGRVVEEGPVAKVFLHPGHPVSRALVREAEGDAALSDPGTATGQHLRLTFTGADTHQPLLSRIAREFGVDFAILGGRVGHIRTTPYAQFSIALSGGDAVAATAALQAAGAAVEVIGGAAPAAAPAEVRHLHVV
ncbi:ATP-binding cassette domain-containing protein [Xinfangfangia sp. D13-10-4-6]|uniref:methionine ABC transporter ATP-binding protein n=1 Tax=Pseudogemmobacter hezensis TaxID=2737662 RepID=UPI001555B6D1|nr:ATP-binding cassette domain-containing protein [Pseudogemmobacter hezensis]NPD16046.1 ATP-binding cassette domain-containing protein [Pseudogemmobacter hezensis]